MTINIRLFTTHLPACFKDQVTFIMTQLQLDHSRSCSTMPRPPSGSDVNTRTDYRRDGRIASPSAAGLQTRRLQPAPSSPAKHIGGRSNLATGVWRRQT